MINVIFENFIKNIKQAISFEIEQQVESVLFNLNRLLRKTILNTTFSQRNSNI